MSQLNAEAEGRQVLNQAMMEGSRTGKAAEADLMILIGQPANVEGVDEQSNMRHLNVVKNKKIEQNIRILKVQTICLKMILMNV